MAKRKRQVGRLTKRLRKQPPPVRQSNAEEGGYAEFWDDDIDSELDDAWAAQVALARGLVVTDGQTENSKKS